MQVEKTELQERAFIADAAVSYMWDDYMVIPQFSLLPV